MFIFNSNISILSIMLVWLIIFGALFLLNEVSRRFKWIGFSFYVVLPIGLTILWKTVLSDSSYTDWFHLAKVYSAVAGCIGFWCIRYVKGLRNNKIVLCFPPIILAINILEACSRDFQVSTYTVPVMEYMNNQVQYYVGGVWNTMNGIAGLLNIITLTGWFGICIRKKTKGDKSNDMLWPDMLWFWILAYDVWNLAYTYNCLPTHAWYCGVALILVPTVCSFTIAKGAWLQHRAQTLALWCMFAQTFPTFQDASKFLVHSSSSNSIAKEAIKNGLLSSDGYSVLTKPGMYQIPSATPNTTFMFIVSLLALIINISVFVFMIYRVIKTKKNPYSGELYTDLKSYQKVKALAE